MFTSSYNSARKIHGALLVVSVGLLLVTATLGMKLIMTMDEGDMAMAGCPFMETGALCQMTVSEHLRAWESLFVAVTHPELLLSLLLVFSISVFIAVTLTGPPEFLTAIDRYRHRPDLALFKPLLLALSDGIIQPKLYS